MKWQVPSIILPKVWTLGTETETIADAVTHVSIEFLTRYLQEKTIHITATEVVIAGAPGDLWAWVELSPYLTTTSGAYWAAIGGGGGLIAPTSKAITVGVGTNLLVHGITYSWTNHSDYARLVVQTPAPGAAAYWILQAIFGGK